MENGLFRKKSMDRISSPEELHDYILQNPVDMVRFGYITEPDHRVMLHM